MKIIAKAFFPIEGTGNCVCQPLRIKPFNSLSDAVAALHRRGLDGYCHELGKKEPIFSTLH